MCKLIPNYEKYHSLKLEYLVAQQKLWGEITKASTSKLKVCKKFAESNSIVYLVDLINEELENRT